NDRLLTEHEHVERIAVLAVGPGQEAVIGGVVDRAVEHAIDAQQARRLVQLVLDLRALGNLDHDVHTPHALGLQGHVVPGMHRAASVQHPRYSMDPRRRTESTAASISMASRSASSCSTRAFPGFPATWATPRRSISPCATTA